MDKQQLYDNLNEGILAERLAAFERNLRKNLPFIKQHGGLKKIIPDFEGKTAVVIGAGPSLEVHFGALRRYQHRRELVYIAADMALRPLVKFGIRPRYVFSCETIPVDFFGGIDTEGMHLIAFTCMSNINLRRWQGGMSFYNWMVRGIHYDRLWQEAGTDLGFVATGNLVSTQAVAFALGCGLSELILVGNDLGYSDRYYVRESVIYSNNCARINRFSSLDTFEINSSRRGMEYRLERGVKSYFTTSQFLAGKYWLEDLFEGGKYKIYDASTPGCSEKYVVKIELDDFFYSLGSGRRRKRRRA